MMSIWNKIKKTKTCWLWQGAGVNGRGYGLAWVNGKNKPAHRIVYELLIGDIPVGLQLDHLCKNRACVNPSHLEPVTAQENILRGNSPAAKFSTRTHCKNGHEYTQDNLVSHQYNWRKCKECNRIGARNAYHKRLLRKANI